MTQRVEVTQGLVWLPPRGADRWRFSESDGRCALTLETRRLFGRVGWAVVTEAWEMPDPEQPAS